MPSTNNTTLATTKKLRFVFKCARKITTVGDLRTFLASVPDDAEHNGIQLAYSHDDEGNHFQMVLKQPSFVTVVHQNSVYHLKLVGDVTDSDGNATTRVLLIN